MSISLAVVIYLFHILSLRPSLPFVSSPFAEHSKGVFSAKAIYVHRNSLVWQQFKHKARTLLRHGENYSTTVSWGMNLIISLCYFVLRNPDFSGLGKGQVVRCCEHGNAP
jgi:hypothetical protein